jgi:hypothetical protein
MGTGGAEASLQYSSALHQMEVSCQLHPPARFTPGKDPPVRIGQEAEWAREPASTLCIASAVPTELLRLLSRGLHQYLQTHACVN